MIGIACSLTVSFCYAIVSVLTRQMQKIHYSILLFYYALFAAIALWIILVIESFINDETLSIMNFTWF